MKSVTLLAMGRDDDYAHDFIFRLKKSIQSNIKFLEKNNIDFEYIIVDWSPIDERYLYKNEEIKDLLSDKRIKNIVVDKSISINDGLNPKVVYEYFAKNIGIRAASKDYVFVINSDIILPQSMWNEVIKVLQGELNTKNFFRPQSRTNVSFIDDNTCKVEDEKIINNTASIDACICGAHSGDFLFVERTSLINNGKGYNEEDNGHRLSTKWQTGMDGEILWNMYNNGMRLAILDAEYIHIKHGNAAPLSNLGTKEVDGHYRMNAHYNNRPNWGYTQYPRQTINDNTVLITASL